MIKNHICDAKKSVITNNHICNAKDSVTDKEAIHGQKRPSRGVLGENYFENCCKCTGEHTCRSVISH